MRVPREHARRRVAGDRHHLLRELLTITAGIPIAISLDGLLEWRHYRELVHEARANIRSELQGDHRELLNERGEAGTPTRFSPRTCQTLNANSVWRRRT